MIWTKSSWFFLGGSLAFVSCVYGAGVNQKKNLRIFNLIEAIMIKCQIVLKCQVEHVLGT